ncbi:MAG: TetR/AcrR family transcriptional regulator [Alphaproteobacteria bacterium]|jgi:TetR/AcrR family transcriptional repressor of nem operon|nr:TetR/AcrR family transcriptional regulator [Alphaproteobacteria bacterium]
MRYKPEHKDQTRSRIVEAAGELFRRHGYDGVGIDQIMAAAKLTRGGFYGYFASKSALFAQVIATEHSFNAMMKRRAGGSREALTDQALEIVDGYLAPENRAEIGRGCSMASLSVDVARAGEAAQTAFSAKLSDLAAEFAKGLEGGEGLDRRAITSIALCVGGAVLARASNDDELVKRLSEACRTAVARELRSN